MSTAPPPSSPASPGWTLTPRQQVAAILLLAFSNFMVMLDMTIANVSVPHIAGSLGIPMDQGAWVITSYAVAEAICLPLTGWLVTRFGVVRVFFSAMFGFGLFSLLCGLAPTLGVLVACRIGQGLCGAPIVPASQALLMRLFDAERRTRAMALWTMTITLGPAIGPILGGYISDSFDWHWIFLINVPIAAFCCVAATVLLSRAETPTIRQAIDFVGLALLVFWIGSLQIMLDIGNDHDWFDDWKIVALALCAIIGFCVFVIWELTHEHPIVDLRIFRHRGFTIAVFTIAFAFGAYFAGLVVIPQWLQTTMGYSAQQAGLVTAFTAMSAMIGGPLAARLTGRIDLRALVTMSLVYLSLWSLVRAHWSTDADFWTLAMPQMLQGFAMPLFMIPLTMTAMNSVNPQETAAAAGMQAFLRTVAAAAATSLVLTYWSHSQRTANVALAGSLDPETVSTTLGAAGITGEQGRAVIAGMVETQARTIALDNAFVMAAIIQLVAATLIWIAPRVQIRSKDAGGH